jgi:hypothetical protein
MTSKLLLATFLAALTLLLLDALTPVDINSLQLSAWLCVATAVCGTTYFGRAFRQWSNRKSAVAFVAVAAIGTLLRYGLVWGGDWSTDTVMYQNRYSANRTIEFQLQNPGPGSYNKRIVDKFNLMPGISWVKVLGKYPTDIVKSNINASEWKKVDIEVNELGLKYP